MMKFNGLKVKNFLNKYFKSISFKDHSENRTT